MAFNPEDYLKSNSKTSIERIAYDAALNSMSGSPQNARGVAKDLSLRIVSEGASLDSNASLVGGQIEAAVISSTEEMYYALAGLDVSRTNGAKLSNLRRSSTRINGQPLEQIHPATKINRAREADRIEILTVL